MFWSQVLNGVMLPFVLIFMLILINNKDLMGDYVNRRGLQHRLLGHRGDHGRPDPADGGDFFLLTPGGPGHPD